MADILNLISDAERLEFSQNLSVARPAYIGDRIFPDQKTFADRGDDGGGAEAPRLLQRAGRRGIKELVHAQQTLLDGHAPAL